MGPEVWGSELKPLKDLYDVKEASFLSSTAADVVIEIGRCADENDVGDEERTGEEAELLSVVVLLIVKNSLSMRGPPAEDGAVGGAV